MAFHGLASSAGRLRFTLRLIAGRRMEAAVSVAPMGKVFNRLTAARCL